MYEVMGQADFRIPQKEFFKSPFELTEMFLQAMAERGLSVKSQVVADGKIHRFQIQGRKLNQDGWYCLNHAYDMAFGAFGDWQDGGEWESWTSKQGNLSFEEAKRFSDFRDEIQKKQTQEKIQRQKEAALEAQTIWENASEATQHDYTTRKGVSCKGLKIGSINGRNRMLLIPMYNDDQITSLQGISPDGKIKTFLSGGKKGMFPIGDLESGGIIVIGEGWATMASIYMGTGYACVVAFDAPSLPKVAQETRKKYPTAKIYLAQDNDEAGQKACQTAHQAMGGIIVDTGLSTKGADFNDLAVEQGLEAVKACFEENEQNLLKQEIIQEDDEEEDSYSPYQTILRKKGYRNGVYYQGHNKKGEPLALKWICSPLEVRAKTNNGQGGDWGYLLWWLDSDNREHEWSMPAEMLHKDEYIPILKKGGVIIEDKKALSSYIQSSTTKERVRRVDQTGWYENTFVFPNGKVVGELDTGHRVMFQSNRVLQAKYGEAGKLDQWKQKVSHYCERNSRLAFSICVGFSGGLLKKFRKESGGFHLQGGSSSGKSTCLRVAASLWGGEGYVRSWNTTNNGLEGAAQDHNDGLLVLDEMGQSNAKEIGKSAYLLANGMGKSRADKTGAARSVATWTTTILSSGEITLSDHMVSGGEKAKAGQEVRFPSVPADAGKGLKGLDDLYDFENGQIFVDTLVENAEKYYGTAGIAFVENLMMQDQEKLSKEYKEFERNFIANVVPEGADSQITRVASRFAVSAFAGELATKWGITGWQAGSASEAVITCFNAWLKARGGTESGESMNLIHQIKGFIEAHSETRFQRLKNDPKPVTHNRVGFTKGHERIEEDTPMYEVTQYFVLRENFKTEMCKGFDINFVLRELIDRGILIPDSQGKYTQLQRLPSLGRDRCYVLCAKKLSEIDFQ
jgi:putative DNA primase/helicase